MAEAASPDVHIRLGGQFGYQNAHIHTSKVLGTGSYGSVVKATLDHLPCAAKILHIIFFRDDDPGAVDFSARFNQECEILRNLKHPCIVQFLCVVQDPHNRRPILLMELMDESLTGFLERAVTSIPYHVQLNITHDIALALAYLHGNNIIHRDLSSNNILLKGGSQTKVTDFGMSKMIEANPRMTRSKITQCPGTPVFMPPEALRSKPRYSNKLDTFSLGVLIIQIVTRAFPAPTDAELVLEDDSAPSGEKIILVPELERRQKDINKVPADHGLLPTAIHCLKDKDKDRPTAAQLCQSLGQLKKAQAYTASQSESQQSRLVQEKEREIARLQEQMRRLSTEKEREQHARETREREVAQLRRQLQTSPPRAPVVTQTQIVTKTISRPKVSIVYKNLCKYFLMYIVHLIKIPYRQCCLYRTGLPLLLHYNNYLCQEYYDDNARPK